MKSLFLFVGLVLTVVVFSVVGDPIIFWTEDPVLQEILWKARFPRVLLAAFVGAGLSVSGVAFQSLLRNPLADPYILGVSGGAALGGILSVALGLPFQIVSLIAFASALGSLFLIYAIARTQGGLPAHTLLLTGVIFNSFSFALILFVYALANMGQMHQIFSLLVGSLEAYDIGTVLWVGLLISIGCVLLSVGAAKMNLMALGEDSATQLGLSVRHYRKFVFVAASLMVGASVAIAGLIGFVGLFVPHVLRLILGSDHRVLIPASAFGGGIFLIMCDFLAKTAFSGGVFQTQLPVGVVTALIGGPFFVYLLKRSK